MEFHQCTILGFAPGIFLLGIYWHRQLDEPLDGIIYGTAVGLGFASVENVIFIVSHDEPMLALTRGFTATLAHVATSGALGFFVGLSRFRPVSHLPFLWLAGLAVAIVFHGVYDYYLFGGGPMAIVALVCLLPLMLVFLGLRIHWARARSGVFHGGRGTPGES
jgi:RsiW-degrading membrane proteinase PrsW (M82 family)